MRALLLTILLTAIVTPAHADLLRTLFPSMFRDTYNPYATMKAPFADNADTAETPDIQTLEDLEKLIPKPSEIVPVHLPHATIKTVRDWVTNAMSDALTFENINLQQEQKDALQYFTPIGQQQYKDFLTTNKITETLAAKRHRLIGIVQNEPFFIGERADQGRYKWLFEVPIMISFIDINADDYERTQPTNRQATLQIQIARSDITESNPHDILIELWQGRMLK